MSASRALPQIAFGFPYELVVERRKTMRNNGIPKLPAVALAARLLPLPCTISNMMPLACPPQVCQKDCCRHNARNAPCANPTSFQRRQAPNIRKRRGVVFVVEHFIHTHQRKFRTIDFRHIATGNFTVIVMATRASLRASAKVMPNWRPAHQELHPSVPHFQTMRVTSAAVFLTRCSNSCSIVGKVSAICAL